MLTIDNFSEMNTRDVLDTISGLVLFYNLDQISPEEYRDSMTCAAERLNEIRTQRWNQWAEEKGIL